MSEKKGGFDGLFDDGIEDDAIVDKKISKPKADNKKKEITKTKTIEKPIDKEECPHCGKEYKNLSRHINTCPKNPDKIVKKPKPKKEVEIVKIIPKIKIPEGFEELNEENLAKITELSEKIYLTEKVLSTKDSIAARMFCMEIFGSTKRFNKEKLGNLIKNELDKTLNNINKILEE